MPNIHKYANVLLRSSYLTVSFLNETRNLNTSAMDLGNFDGHFPVL